MKPCRQCMSDGVLGLGAEWLGDGDHFCRALAGGSGWADFVQVAGAGVGADAGLAPRVEAAAPCGGQGELGFALGGLADQARLHRCEVYSKNL